MNYVYGLNSKYRDLVYSRCTESVCIVDLDKNHIEISLQAIKISQKITSNVEIPNLPKHYGKKLIKRVTNVLSKIGAGKSRPPRLKAPRLDEFSSKIIRESFFQFFVSIFMNYQKFLNSDMFDKNGFVSSSDEKDKAFMADMLNTQIFANFLATKIKPKSQEEQNEILLFDEQIIAKMNRSVLKSKKLRVPFKSEMSNQFYSVYQVPSILNTYKIIGLYEYTRFPDFDLDLYITYGLPKNHPPKYAENLENESILNFDTIDCKTDIERLCTIWIEL